MHKLCSSQAESSRNVQLVKDFSVDAGAVLDRLRDALNLDSDAELARVFGLSSQSALTNWRRRNSLDHVRLAEIAAERGLSLDWLYGITPPVQSPPTIGDTAQLARDAREALNRLLEQVERGERGR